MNALSEKTCSACEGNGKTLSSGEAQDLRKQLHAAWQIVNNRLTREFDFHDFKSALAFTNQVGELAEKEGHHPDIFLSWGKVRIELWTHSMRGLTENDFILAAKIDGLDGQWK